MGNLKQTEEIQTMSRKPIIKNQSINKLKLQEPKLCYNVREQGKMDTSFHCSGVNQLSQKC